MSKGKKHAQGTRSVQLGGGVGAHVLDVEIAHTGKTYHVPMPDSLQMGDAMLVRKAMQAPKKQRDDAFFEAFYTIVCKYVPQKYIDSLSMEEFSVLAQTWNGTAEDGGASLGE